MRTAFSIGVSMDLSFQESVTSESCNLSAQQSRESCNAAYKSTLYHRQTMNTEIGNRIDRLIRAAIAGANQSILARFVGVSPQAVQQWVAGATAPRGKNLTKVADFFELSPAVIQFGASASDLHELERRRRSLVALRGEVMVEHGITNPLGVSPDNPSAPAELREVQAEIEKIGRILEALSLSSDTQNEFSGAESLSSPKGDKNMPNLATVSRLKARDEWETISQFDTGGSMGAGLVLRDQPGVIHGWQVNREWLEKNARNNTGAQNLCIVTGFGDSMRPMFNPGDPLLVDTGVKTVEADGIFFFRIGNDGFIKRLQRIPGEDGMTLWAISQNKDYKDFPITERMDFEVLGKVIRVWCGTDF